jgi:hypothetical protein
MLQRIDGEVAAGETDGVGEAAADRFLAVELREGERLCW